MPPIVKHAQPLKSGKGTAAVTVGAGGSLQIEVLVGSGPVDPTPPADAGTYATAVTFCDTYAATH